MFGRNHSLASQTLSPANTLEKVRLEPHVDQYDIHSTSKSGFTFPFQVISYCLISLVILGLIGWLFTEDFITIKLVLLIQLFFAPFYLPGLYYYFSFLKREKQVELELDSRNQLIKYFQGEKGLHVLFHLDQIEQCVLNVSLIFPYKIDYLSLQLKGGPQIYISSLLIDPAEILSRFAIEYTIEKRMFNPLP
jgi:hypothetical protein